MKRFVWYALRGKDILINLLILFAAWLFGVILHDIILFASGDSNAFPFGTMFALMALVFLGIFANWASMIQDFNLSVSMGATRREFMIQYSVQYFISMVIDFVFVFLLNLYEEARVGWYFSDWYLEVSFRVIFQPVLFVLVPFVLLGIGLLMGGIGIKFGSNSRWIVILIWIAFCLAFTRIGNGALLDMLFSLPAYAYGLIFTGLSIVFCLISVLIVRKQRVDV